MRLMRSTHPYSTPPGYDWKGGPELGMFCDIYVVLLASSEPFHLALPFNYNSDLRALLATVASTGE